MIDEPDSPVKKDPRKEVNSKEEKVALTERPKAPELKLPEPKLPEKRKTEIISPKPEVKETKPIQKVP